uniref:Uncharacterized protein n=1 Tax=Arundo donax TaxID=35708 RepID=A0A0A9AU65_ARUDO
MLDIVASHISLNRNICIVVFRFITGLGTCPCVATGGK